MVFWLVGAIVVLLLSVPAFRLARRKNVDIIVASAISRRRERFDGQRHVFFCFVDHFEPLWHGAGRDTALERTRAWHREYPRVIDSIRDRSGRVPQHNFFYPEEEYLPECVDLLADLAHRGYGSVEVHLHHHKDTSENLRVKLEEFKKVLHDRHGLLNRNPLTGEIQYGFIHGNWTLDDSGPHGWGCGVRDEITILRDTGCYADFTYPSAPHPTQPPICNRIYYATDDPSRPKSHHTGEDAYFKSTPIGDLLMVNGPLALNWRLRRRGIFPAVENGEVAWTCLPSRSRVDLWLRVGVAVKRWPRWVFVKVYTHGAQEKNVKLMLSDGILSFHKYVLERYDDGDRHILHYVTPWEIYWCVKALEAGDMDWISRVEAYDYSLKTGSG
jgi:hypothetical protein